MRRSITFEYRFEEQSAVEREHIAWHFTGKRALLFAIRFALLVSVFVSFSLIISGQELDLYLAIVRVLIIGLLLGILALLFFRRLWPRLCVGLVSKDIWEQELGGKSITFVLDDERVTVEDSDWSRNFAWAELTDWSENRQFLMILRADEFFYYFPKAQVSEEDLAFVRE